MTPASSWSRAWTSRAAAAVESLHGRRPRRAHLRACRPAGVRLGDRGALPPALAARTPGGVLVVHDAAAAEDIAQEAFLAAVRNLDRFDRGRPFGPWLHRIVVNRAIDWARARQMRGEVELVDARCGAGGAAQLDDSLLAALAALPPTTARDRPQIPARVHAGRDRRAARLAERNRQLAPAPRARLARGDGVKQRAGAGRDPERARRRERSWAVVSAAFAERETQPRSRSWKPVAVVALAVVVVAGLLSPPGRAVLDEIREVVGVEGSAPALFALPAPGRLLVAADRECGSSTKTARSGCSATTARRRGRRSAATSSLRARTSWWR